MERDLEELRKEAGRSDRDDDVDRTSRTSPGGRRSTTED
jgi:hypothetical protein